MSSEAQRRASAKYDKENTYKITVKLNRSTDADLIQLLDASGNKQLTIKEALRKYMKEEHHV